MGSDRVIHPSLADMQGAHCIPSGGPGSDFISTAWGVDEGYGDAGGDELVDIGCDTSRLSRGPGADPV
jgi:hypothetical protein